MAVEGTSASAPARLRIGVITLGGPRREAMEDQFAQLQRAIDERASAHPEDALTLEVTYIDGVQGASLKKKEALREAAQMLIEVCVLCACACRALRFTRTENRIPSPPDCSQAPAGRGSPSMKKAATANLSSR